MLESAEQGQQQAASDFLNVLLSTDPSWISDEDIREYLRQHCPQPPKRFSMLLCASSPRRALLALDAAYSNPDRHREIIWADHVVADAIWKDENKFLTTNETNAASAQLQKLRTSDEWWVRLYVVEIMNKHEFLRDERVLESLRRDKHESVRRAARREE